MNEGGGIAGRARHLLEGLGDRGLAFLDGSSRPLTAVRGIWAMTTRFGRTVAVLGVASWFAGWWLGWKELMVTAALCLFLLLGAAAFVVGRAVIDIRIRLEPPRVVVGDTAVGQVDVTNHTPHRLASFPVVLPVGEGVATFEIHSLGAGESDEELLVIPTNRRGVIPVGPATSMRTDPLGLYHRATAASDRRELLVHPRTVALSPFGSGLLRDLEGLTTPDLSMSDLAFHALREYAPGDDRRHVHWRSSAKAGRLLVRQFLDTRRSTLCAVVDSRPDAYPDAEEFETALSVAGSVSMRACKDGLPTLVLAGGQAASGASPHLHLDALSRAGLSERAADLPELVSRASARRADISVSVIVSGSGRTTAELQRAASRFPQNVQVLALRIAPGRATGIVGRGRATVVQLASLSDLPALLRMQAVS